MFLYLLRIAPSLWKSCLNIELNTDNSLRNNSIFKTNGYFFLFCSLQHLVIDVCFSCFFTPVSVTWNSPAEWPNPYWRLKTCMAKQLLINRKDFAQSHHSSRLNIFFFILFYSLYFSLLRDTQPQQNFRVVVPSVTSRAFLCSFTFQFSSQNFRDRG